MTWQAIESKLLSAVAYDAEHSILYLRFRDSGDVYRFFEFPPEQHTHFLAAESRGRYFLPTSETISGTNAWPEFGLLKLPHSRRALDYRPIAFLHPPSRYPHDFLNRLRLSFV